MSPWFWYCLATETTNLKLAFVNFKEGDEIIQTGWRVGEIYFGGYSQFAKVDGKFLVKRPDNLSSRQAMILGTAGLTALQCAFAVKAREELLKSYQQFF